jgi:PAS domain S-box-containing protein
MPTPQKSSQSKTVKKKQIKKSPHSKKTAQKTSTKKLTKLPRGSKTSRATTKSVTSVVTRPSTQPEFPIVGIGVSAGGLKAKQALEASEREQRSLAQMNAGVLNALLAHIAIVDAKGVVLSVNESWKRFASENGFKDMNFGIGRNYIAVCKNAHGYGAEEAQAVGKGLKAVLAGKLKSFAFEYPCHAPKEQRWFRVMISCFSEAKRMGAVVMHLDITERRQAQEALEKEQQFISTILDTAGALVVVLDPEWRILRFNRACENLTGRNIEEMRGKTFIDLSVVSGEDAQEVKNLLLSFKGRQFPKSFESAWVDQNRQLHWIRWSNTVVTDKEGKTENIIATGIDITNRKRAEGALSREQKFISAVLNTAGALVVVLDRRGKIVRFNRACEELTGHSFEDVLGKRIWDFLLPPEEILAVKKVFEDLRKEALPNQFESHWITKDNQTRQIAWSNTVLINDKGEVDHVIGIGIDVTERRKAEQTIDRLWRQNELILHSVGEGIYGIDSSGKAIFFNQAAERLTGWNAEELLGQVIHPVLHHTKLDGTPYLWEECPIYFSLKKGETHQIATDIFWRKDDTHFPAEFTSTPIYSENGNIEGAVVTFNDITERKKAEAALLNSEKKAHRQLAELNLLYDTTPIGLCFMDADLRFVRINQALASINGPSIEEHIGRTLEEVIPNLVAQVKPIYLKVLETREPVLNLQVHGVTPAEPAQERDWLASYLPVIEEGNVLGVTTVVQDITERGQAEQALRESEARLNEAQHIANIGSWELDLVTNKLIWSNEIHRIFEMDPKCFGATYEAFLATVHPEDRDSVNHAYTESVKNNTPYDIVHRLLFSDGRIKFVHERCENFYDGEGNPVRSHGTVQDITAQKQAETKVRESEERFQAFMNHSPTVAFLKNEKGQYVYVNQLWEEKLHLSSTDCLGKTDLQLFPPDVARIFKEHDQEALTTREVLETEETTLDETGKVRYWWVMKFPVYGKEGQLMLGGVALDITFRKVAEEALQQREVELQESQEVLQALGGKLISAQEDERRRISRELHDDMNQRLAVLALNIQSAQKGIDTVSPAYRTLQKLYDGVSSLSDDVRHLAYQLHPSILDDLGLKVALQSFVDDFSKWEGIPVVFTSTDISFSLPQEIGSCLYRVTQECLRNIARHAQATQVDVKLIEEDEGLRLFVKDNGKGFKVEETRAGKAGLGLIGMQERVRAVQGTYELKSATGKGTEITVWVPIPKAGSS